MRRTALAVAIIAAVSLGLSSCGSDDDPKLEAQTLNLTEKDTDDFGFADNPPKTKVGEEGPEKLSPGDKLTFRANFVDASKKDIGDLDVACTITKGGRFDKSSSQCSATVTLPDGTLAVSVGGRTFTGGTTRGAVIGGTGKYAGATGTFSSKQEKGGTSKDVFKLFVPKE